MKRVAIQDANILIDLIKTGLFDHCLSLPYEFITTDLIFDELFHEQALIVVPHINSGKFAIISTSNEDLQQIQQLNIEDRSLSPQDWSAIYFAEKRQATLLTGDKKLKTVAISRGIVACGMLWIMDQLVESHVLSKADACRFIKELAAKNKRLPGPDCDQRISKWCGDNK